MASSITSSDNSEGILLSASFGRVFLITFFFCVNDSFELFKGDLVTSILGKQVTLGYKM